MNGEPERQSTEPSAVAELEAALEEALRERNRLWEQLQRVRAVEADLSYWRARAESFERSRWWKLGLPLRLVKRLREDAPGTLEAVATQLRKRARGR